MKLPELRRGGWLRRLAGLALAGVLANLAALSPVEALSITGLSVTTTGTNTADFTDDVGSERSQNLSATSSTAFTPISGSVADTVGSTVSFSTRYASLLAADADTASTTQSRTQVSAYQVQFTVNAGASVKWVVTINTRRVGDMTVISDTSGNSGTTASLGAVTGTVNGNANAALGLPLDSFTGPNGNADGDKAFSQDLAGVLTLQGSGTQTFTLAFTWTDTVTSAPAADEVAIRMGLAGTLTGLTADDYPGNPSRTLTCNSGFTNCDGHFVDVNVIVPHPPTLSLLGIGVGAISGSLWWRRWRRR